MEKILYLSDLDGTLFNSKAEVSEYTARTLNRLIDNGMLFSFATARTAETVVHILKDVNIQLPVILMNGTLVYDWKSKHYLKINSFSENALEHIIDAICKFSVHGFYFTLDDEKLNTRYVEIATEYMREFMNERIEKFNKPFERIDDIAELKHHRMIYFSFQNEEKVLRPFYESLKNNSDITISFYHDVYNCNIWYLEISPKSASKYDSTLYLKEYLNADKIVAFGDNLNDIPLFMASDEGYAVENAMDELKKRANGVILSNNDDGVAKYLENIK